MRQIAKGLEEALQDDEFALEFAKCLKQDDKIIQRTLYSSWKLFWRIYYHIVPARFTGL